MSIARPVEGRGQLALFDTGLNLDQIRRSKQRLLMSNQQAVNTSAAYAQAWKNFEEWCHEAGRSPLPASSDTLELYCAWGLTERQPTYSPQTVNLAIAAVADRHRRAGLPVPVTPEVRAVVSAAKRDPLTKRPKCKLAVTAEQVALVCQLPIETTADARNRSLFLFTFASGLRRSEVASFDLDDVTWDGDDVVLWLGRSKTDQTQKGRPVRITRGSRAATCPVRSLKAWLKIRGERPGPVWCQIGPKGRYVMPKYRLDGQTVSEIVKALLAQIGVDPANYGAHSLRAGMVTTAAELGASEIAIRERTGHRDLNMLAKYVRSVRALRADPLAGAL